MSQASPFGKNNRSRLAVIMDPITAIQPAKDSTLAMLLAAQSRGWQIYYGTLNEIWLRDGQAKGHLKPLRVFDDSKHWFEWDEPETISLGDMDAILMRKAPPPSTWNISTSRIFWSGRKSAAWWSSIVPRACETPTKKLLFHGSPIVHLPQ